MSIMATYLDALFDEIEVEANPKPAFAKATSPVGADLTSRQPLPALQFEVNSQWLRKSLLSLDDDLKGVAHFAWERIEELDFDVLGRAAAFPDPSSAPEFKRPNRRPLVKRRP